MKLVKNMKKLFLIKNRFVYKVIFYQVLMLLKLFKFLKFSFNIENFSSFTKLNITRII